jgi:hypothetical protein
MLVPEAFPIRTDSQILNFPSLWNFTVDNLSSGTRLCELRMKSVAVVLSGLVETLCAEDRAAPEAMWVAGIASERHLYIRLRNNEVPQTDS